jgi:hypothetical protein
MTPRLFPCPGRNRTKGTNQSNAFVHVEAHYGLERSGVHAGTPITPTVLTPASFIRSAGRGQPSFLRRR